MGQRPNRLGSRQRIVLGFMLLHNGVWPSDVRMSEREYQAVNKLARRGWVERAGNTFKICWGRKAQARRLLGK